MAVRACQDPGRGAPVHGRRRRPEQGPVRPVRHLRATSDGCQQMNAAEFDLMIIVPALLAGLLVLVTHIPLGMQVLKRGIVFIDLAIAQIAALGVIIAGVGDLDPQGWAVQGAAALAAVLGAVLLTWTEKRWPE